MSEHRIVLSIYMTVEAETKEEAFSKAEEAVDEVFEPDVQHLDGRADFTVDNWFCDHVCD